MDANDISQKIFDLYRTGQEDVLRGFIRGLLEQFRPQAFEALELFFPRVDGKGRLKVLEILIEDGGEDLIPLFVARVVNETNRLFAKSMLGLVGQFEHYEALTALQEVDDKLPGELKPVYQRIVAKFSAKFREHFYMNEFRSGVAKRVHAAANNMLKEPNKVYVEFLNNIIFEDDSQVRSEAVRVMAELGDASSIEALFSLIEKIHGQIEKGEILDGLILMVVKKEFPNREILLRKMVSFQDADDRYEEFEPILQNKVTHAKMEALFAGYQIAADHFQRECLVNFEKVLLGLTPPENELKRLRNSSRTYLDNLHVFLLNSFRTLGRVAHRNDDHSILEKVDKLLPEESPERDLCLVAVLSGYRAENARERLVAYANESDNPRILNEVLKALSHYQLDEVPEGIKKLALSDETNLRRQALQLIGQWGKDLSIFETLLDSDSLIVVADAVSLIAEFKLEPFYERLLAMLEKDLPNSLHEAVIRALSAFPDERTGKALAPFLAFPGVYLLRQAALDSLFTAGGEGRFQLITEAFKSYPKKHLSEVIGSFLDLMLKEDFSHFEKEFHSQMEFWEYLLNFNNEKFRLKMLQLLENYTWPTAAEDGDTWIAMIQRVLHAKNDFRRTGLEERKLRVLIHVINNKKGEGDPPKKKASKEHGRDELEYLMEQIDTGNHEEQVNAVRRLSLFYRVSMLEDNKELLEHLVNSVSSFLDRNIGANELLVLGIGLAGKIDDPRLNEVIQNFLNHDNKLVARAARKMLEASSDESDFGFIKHILVLDGSRYITKQLAKVLASNGYIVDATSDMAKGLTFLGSKKYELFICEMVLPGMKGWELLARLSHKGLRPKHTLIITSNRDEADVTHMLSAKVDGLFYKPFPMQKLLDQIKKLELS